MNYFVEGVKKKIKGYSTKELDIIKNSLYFRQFKNIDEERKYIYKKLKIIFQGFMTIEND